MIFRFKLFGREHAIKYVSRRVRTKLVKGMTNLCEDGLMCVFLDYDNSTINRVIRELKTLQNLYDLSTFYIFQSSEKGFHCICLDKVSFHEHLQILRKTSVDENYLNVPSKYGEKLWTLRLSEKNGRRPRFITRLSNEGSREQSNAHARLLEKIYDIDVVTDFPDGNSAVVTAEYKI